MRKKLSLFNNFAEAMEGLPLKIVKVQLGNFDKVDPAYGDGIRVVIGIRQTVH